MAKATANIFTANTLVEPCLASIELVCTANNLASLKAAVDNGANYVRLEYGATGQMHDFSAMRCNFTGIAKGIRYAHHRKCKVALELDIAAHPSIWACLRDAIDLAARAGVDAVLLSDPSLTLYMATRHPGIRVHYASRESDLNTNAIHFLQKQLGVARIILPRIMSLVQAELLARHTSVELELVGFGLQSVIVKARHAASTDVSCRFSETADSIMDRCGDSENASNDSCYRIEHSPEAHTLGLLPQLVAAGIHAIKIDLRGREARRVGQITDIWREAIDHCLSDLDHYSVKPAWVSELNRSPPMP